MKYNWLIITFMFRILLFSSMHYYSEIIDRTVHCTLMGGLLLRRYHNSKVDWVVFCCMWYDLQINPDGKTGLSYVHTNGPHPPSSRPPVTPRTPRTPRRNGFLVRQSSDETPSISGSVRNPVPASRSSSSPSRSGGPPQKRSPSTPMEEDEEAQEERRNDRDISSGSKRMRSEIKVGCNYR